MIIIIIIMIMIIDSMRKGLQGGRRECRASCCRVTRICVYVSICVYVFTYMYIYI